MTGRANQCAARRNPHGKTIPQLLLERSVANGDILAQRHKRYGVWKRFTWSDVVAAVKDCSLGLAELGLSRNDIVAIIGENEPEFFHAEFAVQSQGAAVVCLYPDQTAEEIGYILSHSGAKFLFAQDQEQVDKILSILDSLPLLSEIIYWDPKGLSSYDHPKLQSMVQLSARGADADRANPEAFTKAVAGGRPDNPAVLLYSSGTTGKPKAIQVSHNFLIDNCLRILGCEELRPGAEYLSYISPAWGTEQIFGVAMGIINPMVVNFPERPESVLHDLREIGVECLCFTPRQWESLASDIHSKMQDALPLVRRIYGWALNVGRKFADSELEGRTPTLACRLQHLVAERLILRPLRDQIGLKNARIAASGGAAMAPDVFRFFHAMGVPLRNAYGLTEFGWIAMHRGKKFDLETVGSLLPVDPGYGEALKWRISSAGELQVRGGSGFPGYLGLPEKTAERWDDGWFRTGDHCRIAESGELIYFERVEDLRTLSTGFRYPPQFIETRLRFSPFIKDVMVVGDETAPYPIALVNINSEVVGRWAEERGIGYSTFADLSQREEVRELIKGEIAQVNAKLDPEARGARFANFPKELDADEGDLSRTRKLRRGLLVERYAVLIAGLYNGTTQINFELEVRYQDGRKGRLNVNVWGDSSSPVTATNQHNNLRDQRPREKAVPHV